MELVLDKVQKLAEEYSSLSKSDLYKLLFPYPVNNKDAIAHLLDYSFGRQRYIIRYFKLIIQNNPEATSSNPKCFRECA